jgi:hypothetical protein
MESVPLIARIQDYVLEHMRTRIYKDSDLSLLESMTMYSNLSLLESIIARIYHFSNLSITGSSIASSSIPSSDETPYVST